MAQPLEKRITSALRSSSRLADVETTIGDVETEIDATEARLAGEQARSIDPALSTPEARDARNAVADLEHDLRRLGASLDLLRGRRQAILDDDSYAKRRARYEAARAERDDLAEHIRARYPELALELAELAERIIASDAECAAVNNDRPRGEPELASAEQIARGYTASGSWEGAYYNPALRLIDIKLPLLNAPGNLWPARGGRPRDAEAEVAKKRAAEQARAKATVDREASKKRYVVSCDGGVSFPAAIHADGMDPVRGVLDLWMYPEQVELNRRKGLTVEPWTAAKAAAASNRQEVADAAA